MHTGTRSGWGKAGSIQKLLRLGLAAGLGLHAFGAAALTTTRVSAFEYDAQGLLSKEIIEPDDANLCLVTTYVRDSFGNVTSTTTRNCNGSSSEAAAPTGDAVFVSRTSSTGFDAQGRFATSSTNALSQSETRAYEANFGGMTSLIGPNALTTTWTYDSFGRKSLETRADGTKTQWTYVLCSGVGGGSASCPTVGGAAGKYYVQTTPLASDGVTANGPYSRTYFDALSREIRSETLGFNGTTKIFKDNVYDSLGRASQVSRPYFDGGTAYWSSVDYDLLGRVICEQTAANAPAAGCTATSNPKITRSFNGLIVTTTNPLSQTRVETRNSQGQVVSVTDANSKTLTYSYDAVGNLLVTTDSLNNKVTLTYDTRGRKTQMVDPDMGTWYYYYNALGELIRQKDAKNQIATMVYDKLGRMTSRTQADLVSTWSYDKYADNSACTKGIGKLCEATADNGYKRKITYDSLGRSSQVAVTIDVPGTPYNVSATYDTQGRVATQSYPSGYAIKYVYTALGYLSEVRRNDNNALLWQANSLDATGNWLQFTHGNSVASVQTFDPKTGRLLTTQAGAGNAVQNVVYQYDNVDNLTSRQDITQNLTETFLYDSLNRLTSAQLQGGGISGTQTKTYAYNELGNITKKSDVCNTANCYVYPASGPTSVRPHALTSIVGTVYGVTNPSFTYDANGSLTAGAGRTISYTSYNQPYQITKGTVTQTFLHDTEQARVKQTMVIGSATTTTVYVQAGGLLYEKETQSSGLIVYSHYINAGGQRVAIYLSKSDSTTQTRYLHLDHLGSTSVITNESGTVVERLAYDPFGKRRNANGPDDPANTLRGTVTDRGFTGHEHLDDVALIHMNGRIYDPLIGRFMQADPFINAPGNMQDYNRYSYVQNNPLNATDPTGYFSLRKFLGATLAAIFLPTPHNYLRQAHEAPGARQFEQFVAKSSWANSIISGVLGIVTAPCGGCASHVWAAYSTKYVYGGDSGDAWTAAGISWATSLGFDVVGTVTKGHNATAKYFGTPKHMANILGHAAVGCASAEASGGECRSGAAGAAFGSLVTPIVGGNKYTKFAMVTIAGGIGEELGGGKFLNGAVTSAFGYIYNQSAGANPFTDASQISDTGPATNGGWDATNAAYSQYIYMWAALPTVAPLVVVGVNAPEIAVAVGASGRKLGIAAMFGMSLLRAEGGAIVLTQPTRAMVRQLQDLREVKQLQELMKKFMDRFVEPK